MDASNGGKLVIDIWSPIITSVNVFMGNSHFLDGDYKDICSRSLNRLGENSTSKTDVAP